MIRDRFLMLLIASLLAIGIYFSDFFFLSSEAMWLLVVLMSLLLVSLCLLGKQSIAIVPFALFFVVAGIVRAQLGTFSLLPDALLLKSEELLHRLLNYVQHVGLSRDTAGLIQAMLLGNRAELSGEVLQIYRNSGTSHILALSGLHLGILFGLFNYWLMRVLFSRWRYVVGIVGLVFLWGYALLTGFPISLCRASLMMSLLVIGQMRLVGNDGWHTLGLAAFVILLIAPDSLYEVGFQLSFTAVAGILMFYRPLCDIWLPSRWWTRGIWQIFLVSVSAQLGTFPLILYYFHQVSWLGLFISPLFILLATCIVYVGLLLLGVHALGGGFLLGRLLEGLVGIQHGLMGFCSHLSSGRIVDVSLPFYCVVLLYIAILCLRYSLWLFQKDIVRG